MAASYHLVFNYSGRLSDTVMFVKKGSSLQHFRSRSEASTFGKKLRRENPDATFWVSDGRGGHHKISGARTSRSPERPQPRPRVPGHPTNREGLTFQQWERAANLGRPKRLRMAYALSEWRAGVDPTEHAGRESGRPEVRVRMVRGSRSTERGPRASRARRGPKDEASAIARKLAKWSPAGRRLRGVELDEWRMARLKSVLEANGLGGHYGRVKHLVVVDPVKRSHKSDSARFRRAYGWA